MILAISAVQQREVMLGMAEELGQTVGVSELGRYAEQRLPSAQAQAGPLASADAAAGY